MSHDETILQSDKGDLGYIRRELERLREVSDHFAVVGLIVAPQGGGISSYLDIVP